MDQFEVRVHPFISGFILSTGLATNWESQYAWRLRIFKPWAKRSPARSASYSASLFEAWNSNLNDCSKSSLVGDVRRIPISDPCLDEDPSTWRSQVEFGSSLVMVPVGSSTKKSASTRDFALVLGRYSMSYSLSSTAHLASRPD